MPTMQVEFNDFLTRFVLRTLEFLDRNRFFEHRGEIPTIASIKNFLLKDNDRNANAVTFDARAQVFALDFSHWRNDQGERMHLKFHLLVATTRADNIKLERV